MKVLKRPTVSSHVLSAITVLFEGFKTSKRPESAWAREMLKARNPTSEEIADVICDSIDRYCPKVPVEYIPFLVELLTAGIRFARRDEEWIFEDEV